MANPPAKKQTPIRVYLRIRPPNEHEGPSAITSCTPKEIHLKHHNRGYAFDQIFDHQTTQVRVYKTVVGEMINDVMKGYNCTVFAYGQTGTGKTYTILGGDSIKSDDQKFDWQRDSDAGIILRSARHLYEELDRLNPDIQRTVTVSFMEIYNEEIRDLLNDKDQTPLRIYEDKSKIVRVKNLQEVTVLNPWEIISLLRKGCERRQVASTLMNNRSSRSHTVFTINVSTIQTISVAGNLSSITCGKLNLIDLAGSENIAKSGSKEQRAREASNINQSLLTLGRVIKALDENSSHVPYRESKLTRILQDSLGGKTKTSIIATISPGLVSLEETVNTLEYAHKARNVTNCPMINLRTSATASAVNEELNRLKRDLFATANEQGIYMDKENYNEMTQRLTQYKEDIVNKHDTIKAMTEQLENLIAQRDEWENLRESFEKTRQAYQECQSEIQNNKDKMQKDSLLLDYFENNSSKLMDMADLMVQRESHLHMKVESLYSVCVQNQSAVDTIIETVEKAMDNLVTQDNRNSQDLTLHICRLIDFNDKICHMLKNVMNQLVNKADDERKTMKLLRCKKVDAENTILVQISNIHESLDHVEDKLNVFIGNCDSRLGEMDRKIEVTKTHISCLEAVMNDLQSTMLSKIVEIEKMCNEKDENCRTFVVKTGDKIKETQESLSRTLGKEYDDIIGEEKRLLEVQERLNQDQERLRKDQERLRKDQERIRKDQERLIKDQERLRERKQRMADLEKVAEGMKLDEEIEKFEEVNQRTNVENCDFTYLKENISCSSLKALNNLKTLNEQLVENAENKYVPEDIMKHFRNMQNEIWKAFENQLKNSSTENSEMASNLEQISNILDVEGKAQFKQCKQMIDTHVEFVSNAGQDAKKTVTEIFKTSVVPVIRTGDTPKPMRHSLPTRHRSTRDSLVRKLTMDTCTEEEGSFFTEQGSSST